MHNGSADGTGGSSVKTCSEDISGTNCYSNYNSWTTHGSDTYANMTIQDVSWTKSGSDLKVTVKAKIFTGYVGTYLVMSYDKRYVCLKKNNRKYTGSCSTTAVEVSKDDNGNSNWGNSAYMGKGTTHYVTTTHTIKNYASNKGSYSLKMYKSGWETTCSTRANVNDQIFTYQTDYILKIN